MACGIAIKRNLDFNPLYSTSPSTSCHDTICTPVAKRPRLSTCIVPRCGSSSPVTSSVVSSPVGQSCGRKYSSFDSTNGSAKSDANPYNPSMNASKKNSLSSRKLVRQVCCEYQRMKKHRQLLTQNDIFTSSQTDVIPTIPGSSISPDQTSANNLVFPGKQNADIPVLSMTQMGIMCERLLKEQEGRLNEEYEKVLVQELSEQYDRYVKFSHKQLTRQLHNRPASYVS